jgi:hypothetical protein
MIEEKDWTDTVASADPLVGTVLTARSYPEV